MAQSIVQELTPTAEAIRSGVSAAMHRIYTDGGYRNAESAPEGGATATQGANGLTGWDAWRGDPSLYEMVRDWKLDDSKVANKMTNSSDHKHSVALTQVGEFFRAVYTSRDVGDALSAILRSDRAGGETTLKQFVSGATAILKDPEGFAAHLDRKDKAKEALGLRVQPRPEHAQKDFMALLENVLPQAEKMIKDLSAQRSSDSAAELQQLLVSEWPQIKPSFESLKAAMQSAHYGNRDRNDLHGIAYAELERIGAAIEQATAGVTEANSETAAAYLNGNLKDGDSLLSEGLATKRKKPLTVLEALTCHINYADQLRGEIPFSGFYDENGVILPQVGITPADAGAASALGGVDAKTATKVGEFINSLQPFIEAYKAGKSLGVGKKV